MDPASIASHRLDNALLMTVNQLFRRGLEIHVDLHADEQLPRIGKLDNNIGDAKIAEIA